MCSHGESGLENQASLARIIQTLAARLLIGSFKPACHGTAARLGPVGHTAPFPPHLNITWGLAILRDMKSLKTIGISLGQSWPAAEFWERFEKGEFKE
jgi:hypothetical protein